MGKEQQGIMERLAIEDPIVRHLLPELLVRSEDIHIKKDN